MPGSDDFAAGRSAERAACCATAALHERDACCATAALHERGDILAYLRRRRDNAAALASRDPEMCDLARDRLRQLEVIIGEVEGGLHAGEEAVASSIAGREASASLGSAAGAATAVRPCDPLDADRGAQDGGGA